MDDEHEILELKGCVQVLNILDGMTFTRFIVIHENNMYF